MFRSAKLLRCAVRWLRRARYAGRARWCPTCRSSVRRFVTHGEPRRPDVKCPVCRSLERDRLTSAVLASRPDLRRVFEHGGSLLHVAPEPALASQFGAVPGLVYVSGDLAARGVSVQLDVQALPFADHSFDAVYCSHVLEHVTDDRRAMREMHRVLKDDGWAILLVPIPVARTDEDPSCIDPAERRRRFGQVDHVRAYGPDYVDRLRDAGFAVETITAARVLGPTELDTMRVPADHKLFVCRRSGYSNPAITSHD